MNSAWINSVIPIIVAVIGVIGVMVAQGHLFERQAEQQKAVSGEEAIERRRTASLAERRAAYARFLSAKRRLRDKTALIGNLKRRGEALVEEIASNPEQHADWRKEHDAHFLEMGTVYDAREEASDDLVSTLEEIFMLAPLDVVDAAIAWHYHTDAKEPEKEAQAHSRFLNAARQDVGVEPLDRLPS